MTTDTSYSRYKLYDYSMFDASNPWAVAEYSPMDYGANGGGWVYLQSFPDKDSASEFIIKLGESNANAEFFTVDGAPLN